MNFYSDQMSKWQMALFPGSEKNFYKQKKKKPFFLTKDVPFFMSHCDMNETKSSKKFYLFSLYFFLLVV